MRLSDTKSADTFSRWCLGWIPFGIASALVFHGAILSPEAIPPILIRLNDKVVHGSEYFLLFLFGANAFKKASQNKLSEYPYGIALAYCTVMGVVTELVQFYVPGRVPDVWDWAVDTMGAASAWGIIFLTTCFLETFFGQKNR